MDVIKNFIVEQVYILWTIFGNIPKNHNDELDNEKRLKEKISNVISAKIKSTAIPKVNRDGLAWLRALAVLLVIFHHGNVGESWLGSACRGAWIGVELFFVVSGFLVSGSYIAKQNLGTYYAGRARRVYPALIATLAISGIAVTILGGGGRFLNELPAYLTFQANELPKGPMLGPLWSLAVEAQFWLVLPWFAFILVTGSSRFPWLTLTGILLIPIVYRWSQAIDHPAIIAPSGAIDIGATGYGYWVYVKTMSHMDTLGTGVWLCVSKKKIPLWLAPAAVVATVLGAAFGTSFSRPLAWVLFQGTALALGFGAMVGFASTSQWTAPKPVKWLSERIFSLYLAQVVTIIWLGPIRFSLLEPLKIQIFILVSFVVVTLILGAALHAFVERPFLRKSRWASFQRAKELSGRKLAPVLKALSK